MRRKKKGKNNEINESWLLPYSDLLTLLVALFIVLFAMSEIDAQKYESLMNVFESEFSQGAGILENNSGNQDNTPVIDSKDDDDNDETTKDNKEGEIEKEQLESLQQEIDQYIEENRLTEELDTELSGERLFLTISNDVSFETGSAEVNKEGEKIAKEISQFLHTDPPRQIVVSGHTDNRPINTDEFDSNWELSAMRAINFMSLLLKIESLDPEKFSSKERGKHKPIAPNNNKENMAKTDE